LAKKLHFLGTYDTVEDVLAHFQFIDAGPVVQHGANAGGTVHKAHVMLGALDRSAEAAICSLARTDSWKIYIHKQLSFETSSNQLIDIGV
jgi:hypothetical protein